MKSRIRNALAFLLLTAACAAPVAVAAPDGTPGDAARAVGPGPMHGYGPGAAGNGPGLMRGDCAGMIDGDGPRTTGGYGPAMMRGYGPGMMDGDGPGMMNGGGYGPGPGGDGMPGFGHRLQGTLDLTDEQRRKADAIHDDLEKSQWDLGGEMQAARAEMRELMQSEPRDRAKLEASFRRMSDLRQQQFAARLDAQERLDTLLTPEQRKAARRYGAGWMGNR